MTAPIDRAYIEILPDLRKFAPQMKTQVASSMRGMSSVVGNEYQKTTAVVNRETGKMTKATKGVADETKRSVTGMGAMVGAAAGLVAGKLVMGFIDAAEQQRKANMQTAAVIKSTGGAAHVTADQISELSEKLSKQTGIEDDVIQSSANMLLTFTSVRNEVGKGNDIFNQATKVVTDMSVALGEDGKSAAIQLGKALNDPIKGITALRRVGVAFTDEQKNQIQVMVQTGDTLGAQKIILGELNKEFGGSAAAQASASDKMRASWHQLQESVGTALLPVMDALTSVAGAALDLFSKWAPVLTPLILILGGLGAAAWLVHAGMKAWQTVTADLGKILDIFRPKVVAQTVANDALAESEVAAGAAGRGMLASIAGFVGVAGPLVAVAAAATFGLSKLYDATNAFGDSLAGKTLSGIKDLDKVLQANGGTFDQQAQKVLAATLVQNGYVEKLGKAGISAGDLTKAVTGTDEQFNQLIKTWKAGGSPANDTIFSLQRLHDHFRDSTAAGQENAKTTQQVSDAAGQMGSSVDVATAAIQKQQTFLNANNLDIDSATKKYNDAVTAAGSFTAQIGYMSNALATNSGNLINATTEQFALTDALGNAANHWAGARAQVDAHTKSLDANTTDGRANITWALSQIQAINQQAVSYATATGNIQAGTNTLGVNTAALRTSMIQAGFTTTQVDALIQKYAATPASVETSITEQGSAAVLSALGDITNQLHAIADPVWGAKLDFAMNNPSLSRGFAKGGKVQGPGGPTDDVIPIWGSAGEFMVNAASTSRHLPLLNAINKNKFAAGGLLGELKIAMSAAAVPNLIAGFSKLYTNALGLSGGVPGNWSGSQLDWVIAAEAITGTPGSWTAPILRRIMFESGGNPNAINNWDSNAIAGDPSRGLMQTIMSTFQAYHQPGTSGNIYDPVANIAAAINYIKSRYGSIFAIDPPVQGYGNGGTVGRTGLAMVHRGEEVLANNEAQKYRAARPEPAVVELGPGTIRALAIELAKLSITLDGRQVAHLVTEQQSRIALKGPRR